MRSKGRQPAVSGCMPSVRKAGKAALTLWQNHEAESSQKGGDVDTQSARHQLHGLHQTESRLDQTTLTYSLSRGWLPPDPPSFPRLSRPKGNSPRAQVRLPRQPFDLPRVAVPGFTASLCSSFATFGAGGD